MQDPWIVEVTRSPTEAAINEQEARRALGFLIDPTAHHELRGVPSGRSRLVNGSNLDAAARRASDLATDIGIYVTLNPVRPDLGDRAARESDIVHRRNFLVDIDARRPSTDQSATDAEKEEANRVCQAVLADLSSRGWPSPIVIDSGNGWHLVYRIDLPNDALAKQWLKACLINLAKAHDTQNATVDRKVFNAARITKLPGTWVRKGDGAGDRPHRMARITSVPVVFAPVDDKLIRELAGLEPEPKAPALDPFTVTVGTTDHGAYGRQALDAELGRLAAAREGERNEILNLAAFRIGQLVLAGHLDEATARKELVTVAERIGLNDAEIRKTVDSGLTGGKEKPRERMPEARATPKQVATVGPDGKRSYPFDLVVRGSSIEPKRVEWLWPDRVPVGFLTIMAGRTGVGKSFVTLDLAARMTAGELLPEPNGGMCLERSNVLIISEDSPEYVLAPRLLELGADMNRISFMTFEAMGSFDLANTDMLDDAFVAAGRPRLVVIDPPTNFLGAKDEHKNAEVRGVLMKVVVWTMKNDIAVVMITHCNKGIKKDMAAIDRIIGSVAWASTSRIAHILAPDPDDPGRCLFVPMKNNIGEMAKGLAYRIKKTPALAVVEWLGEVDITGDQALHGPGKPRRVVASEWLIERFREKREWASDDLMAAANAAGVSRSAIFEAKETLSLPRARQIIAENGDRIWMWWVPPDWAPLYRE